jgi:DNA-binding PucR family transcriptional regulator
LQRAVEDRLSSYKAADRLSKIDPKEQSLRQLVEQFRNQQLVISKDATLRPPVIFQPNKTADARQASQETDPELKELRQREGRLLNLGIQERAQMPSVSIN